jgi:hypothetical protein
MTVAIVMDFCEGSTMVLTQVIQKEFLSQGTLASSFLRSSTTRPSRQQTPHGKRANKQAARSLRQSMVTTTPASLPTILHHCSLPRTISSRHPSLKITTPRSQLAVSRNPHLSCIPSSSVYAARPNLPSSSSSITSSSAAAHPGKQRPWDQR